MKKITFTFWVTLITLTGSAQNLLHELIKGRGGVSAHFIQVPQTMQTSFNPSEARAELGLDPSFDLILIKREKDNLGLVYYRYYQTYLGIPIENSMVIVHTKEGKIVSTSGKIITSFSNTSVNRPQSVIKSSQAVISAIKHVGAKKFAWQDTNMENALKINKGTNTATYYPSATLVWLGKKGEITPSDLKAVYKVDVYAKKPLSRAFYYVDAVNGSILGKSDIIKNVDATGTANTAYSGTQTIHSDLTSATYKLRDYTKGSGVITLHGESASFGSDYTSTSANWNLTGINQAAMDAHYGVSQTYSFYKTNFNRNSYDNAGTPLVSYVNEPTYLDNAFWDGTSMYFCKRSNSTTYPGGVTGIDVVGHELTHGVTQETSGLVYSYQSGAINESLSDIMGKSVQFWAKPTDINWQMSNDMNWIIRSLSNPNSQGQPDTYLGSYWYSGSGDNGGVHYNSGVGNYMFYLLVTGGTGTNDFGNSFSVTGIGLAKADQIIYRSNSVYLTSTSQYSDWRTACITAASDLYGSASNEVAQVKNAWYAVGLGGSMNDVYCSSTGNSAEEWISKVSIGAINNKSGNNGGYQNYTALKTNLVARGVNGITLTPGYSSTPWTEYFTVYIDYNKDGDFVDAGELVVTTGPTTKAITKFFALPATASNGETRMRVQMNFGSLQTNPCAVLTYGEVEDYTVKISGGTTAITSRRVAENAMTTETAIVKKAEKFATGVKVTPNPTTSNNIKISYSLASTGRVVFRFLDMTGRLIQNIDQGTKSPGIYNFSLKNYNGFSSGNYIVIMTQGDKVIARTPFILSN